MKKNKEKMWFAVFALILAAVLAGSVYDVVREMRDRRIDNDTFFELKEMCECQNAEGSISNTDLENDEGTITIKKGYTFTRHDVQYLKQLNPDCVGWLTVPGTVIDYPVMQSKSQPKKYLDRNFYCEKSKSGVPFLDARCSFSSSNLIIYGHNMYNGTVFASLRRYLEADFMSENNVIIFETSDGLHKFEIFSAARINADDDWFSFVRADTVDEFVSEVDKIMLKAKVKTAPPDYVSRIITLSTCFGNGKNGRLVVLAQEVTGND